MIYALSRAVPCPRRSLPVRPTAGAPRWTSLTPRSWPCSHRTWRPRGTLAPPLRPASPAGRQTDGDRSPGPDHAAATTGPATECRRNTDLETHTHTVSTAGNTEPATECRRNTDLETHIHTVSTAAATTGPASECRRNTDLETHTNTVSTAGNTGDH